MNKVRFNETLKDPNDLIHQLDDKNKQDYGYYLLRSNYKRVKPHSKYIQEGARPRSPNAPYSFMSEDILKNNPINTEAVFRQTISYDTEVLNESNVNNKSNTDRFFVERNCNSINQHLIRGADSSQPYCYITKDPHSNNLPPEYKNSRYGAYPTWGPAETGFRTRSHFVAEPTEKLVNIDMYKRPLTNQTGAIIFDNGRPNNGYYLQRNQYDNTWFNSSLNLNQTDVLKSIEPKTKSQYKSLESLNKTLIRSKTANWPFGSEYVGKIVLGGETL